MTKKIFKSTVLASAAVLILGVAFVMGILYQYFGKQLNSELEKEARYLAYGVEQQGQEYLEQIKYGDSRITYIDENGNVLYDNTADENKMENHKNREEFQEALSKGKGEAVRMSDTLSEKTVYSVFALILQLVQPVLCIIFVMLIIAGVIASKVASKIVEPINELDLEKPGENEIYEEVAPLLGKINRQNRQIQKQLEEARRNQEEFSIITENMQEGLLVIDDSIVRGTQLRETSDFLYSNGAKEVHIRPACPPLLYGCKYLNFSRSKSEMDLITRRVIAKREGDNVDEKTLADYANPDSENYKGMLEDIRKELNFTTLKYHRLDDLVASIDIEPCKLCTYCWSGKE